MRDRSADAERHNHVGLAVLAALTAALVAATAIGTYEASLARAHAVREVAPEGTPDVTQYLPGATGQMGALREPLMAARRASLRGGLDGEDAPIDAFDRLRSIPGHDEEARGLLAEFWDRKAMLAGDPIRRVLYALQARVVEDDESRLRTADSAIAALGALRKARHVDEGAVVWSDARTLVLRGADWLDITNQDAGSSFDLPESDTGPGLVDGRHLVTWGGDTARIWDLEAPMAPVASLKLEPGEIPLSFAGSPPASCVLTSSGRVWRADDGAKATTAARGQWTAGMINATCDRLFLQGVSYRLRGATWTAESPRARDKLDKRDKGGVSSGKRGDVRIETCAPRAPRCVVRDAAGVRSVWDFGSTPPQPIFEGIDCEPQRLSPNGAHLMCRPSQDGVALYGESESGGWTRSDTVLPNLTSAFLADDGTISGEVSRRDSPAGDRSDVLFFGPQSCPRAAASTVTESAWGAIRMQASGGGAVFTYPPLGHEPSGHTEFVGFDARGESLAAASNAWFGERKGERLLEYDPTNSAGAKSYELAGDPFDPATALGDPANASSVRVDAAFFVESPEPSLLLEIGYEKRSTPPAQEGSPGDVRSEPRSASGSLLRAVVRWDLRRKTFCGAPIPGAIGGIAPDGDAVIIDGRVYKVGVCAFDRGLEPTDVTRALAVGPGAALWIARDGGVLDLEGVEGRSAAAPLAPLAPLGTRAAPDGELQVAFSPNGHAFFVRTATSLCKWLIRDDDAMNLDGCRWSAAGWASDAAWAAADVAGETVVVLDRTAEGAAVESFFGGRESDARARAGAGRDEVACAALPRANTAPLAALQEWEDRLGHRFKDQATPLEDTLEMMSPEIVPAEGPAR